MRFKVSYTFRVTSCSNYLFQGGKKGVPYPKTGKDYSTIPKNNRRKTKTPNHSPSKAIFCHTEDSKEYKKRWGYRYKIASKLSHPWTRTRTTHWLSHTKETWRNWKWGGGKEAPRTKKESLFKSQQTFDNRKVSVKKTICL